MSADDEKFPDFFCRVKYQTTTLDNIMDILPLLTNKIDVSLLDYFDSPLKRDMSNLYELIYENLEADIKGTKHLLWHSYSTKYGKNGDCGNVLLPIIDNWTEEIPSISCKILIAASNDASRVARENITKMGNFKPIILDSILSTTNNDHWKSQREHLNLAFIPHNSLSKIFEVSRKRAVEASNRLHKQIEVTHPLTLDINDFLLGETQAQLQLALLGMSDEFCERTNKPIRTAFNGLGPDDYVTKFGKELLDIIEKGTFDLPSETNTKKTLKGPLSGLIKTRIPLTDTENYGNAILIAFAGHDTTGHTLSWLVYELCKHPHYQKRLKQEVSNFFREVGERELVYQDFKKLPFMTKCITESLRLWPAVANGTFRVVTKPIEVLGRGGCKVILPVATNVHIINWTRHRSVDLWGKDAHIFNPDREFEGDELWNGKVFANYNQSSERFSPFSYGPRDCLGKNFAQMEMRLILLYLLKDFTFSLTEEQLLASDSSYLGINIATLGPRNIKDTRPPPNRFLLDNPSLALWVEVERDSVKQRLKDTLNKIDMVAKYIISKL